MTTCFVSSHSVSLGLPVGKSSGQQGLITIRKLTEDHIIVSMIKQYELLRCRSHAAVRYYAKIKVRETI